LAQDINNDGDKTRALITSQYEATLNRQLSDANANIIALQSRFDTAERTRGVEVNTTTTVNQMQQQAQQQQQYGQLYNALWALAQNIQNTNSAINVGSGTQTANPANTNTNIR
jgi:methylthioribose-1-phosphate isomerase